MTAQDSTGTDTHCVHCSCALRVRVVAFTTYYALAKESFANKHPLALIETVKQSSQIPFTTKAHELLATAGLTRALNPHRGTAPRCPISTAFTLQILSSESKPLIYPPPLPPSHLHPHTHTHTPASPSPIASTICRPCPTPAPELPYEAACMNI